MMKRLIFLTIALSLSSGVMYGQSHEKELLNSIEKALSKKDCAKAEEVYGWYKEDTKKTNADIERKIRECKNPSPKKSKPTPPPAAQRGGNSSSFNNFTATVNGYTFTMIAVKGGTFAMGCTNEQGSGCLIDETPVHSVTLSNYYIGKFEVTQKLWRTVMGNDPSHFGGCDECPVGRVSWNDIMGTNDYFQATQLGYGGSDGFLYKLYKLTDKKFRLPTEAEWEYAARGGNNSSGTKYSGANSPDAVAWCKSNSYNKTHPVGQKAANELGIYDMSGNVWEWCSDWYDSGYYKSSLTTDPTGPKTGSNRVVRGGAWFNPEESCRVTYRIYSAPDNRSFGYGFRLALPLQTAENHH